MSRHNFSPLFECTKILAYLILSSKQEVLSGWDPADSLRAVGEGFWELNTTSFISLVMNNLGSFKLNRKGKKNLI
jgi:hypothetical protein